VLKFFELEARFPASATELPPAAVTYVTGQVGVESPAFASSAWTGCAIKRHRGQIQNKFGFREFSHGDEK
jgi:hypothetical protein